MRELAGALELGRLAQFVEAHQHATSILELEDLLLNRLKSSGERQGMFSQKTFENGLLEFFAAQARLGAGFQKVEIAPFFLEGFELASTGAQTARIDASGDQQFVERILRGASKIAALLAQRLERSSLTTSETTE